MWPEGFKSKNTLQALPVAKVNELTLKMLAKSVFELQQSERSVAVTEFTCLPHCNDAPYPDSPVIYFTKKQLSNMCNTLCNTFNFPSIISKCFFGNAAS